MGVRRTRLEFEDHYTQVPNAWARDKRLSRKARGLLVEIMTHRVGWRVTVAGLQAEGPEGRDAIRTGLQELFELGYLVRSQSQGARGRFTEVEYDLCDPSTAVGKSDSGEQPPAAPTEAAGDDAEIDSSTPNSTDSSTDSTAVGLSDVGQSAGGLSDVGQSASKKNISLEDQREEEQGGAAGAAPPAPFCSKHPTGTTRKCRACGDARRRYQHAQAQPPAPPPPRASSWRPGLCRDHLQLEGTCDACEQDARHARSVLEQQFGGAA